MGRKIVYTTHTHLVNITYDCEHCGQFNYTNQEIKGSGTKDIAQFRNVTQEMAQSVNKTADKELSKHLRQAMQKTEIGNYNWIKPKKCLNCHYYQSWNKSAFWSSYLKFTIIFVLIVGYLALVTEAGPFALIYIVGIPALVAIFKLVIPFKKIDKEKRNKPNITF
jgi:predicted nucleic-acid-binding Zn-ribbon protein